MKPPFDIAGDLDTPVSAFLKLASFAPRFLLESVEGGERLGRYSFIGLGQTLELCLDASELRLGTRRMRAPADRAGLLAVLREALATASLPASLPTAPATASLPFTGGLVGYASYDVVRYFERLPRRLEAGPRAQPRPVPALHYVAPRSLLVFDHLTRGIACFTPGARRTDPVVAPPEIVRALHGALPNGAAPARLLFSSAAVALAR